MVPNNGNIWKTKSRKVNGPTSYFCWQAHFCLLLGPLSLHSKHTAYLDAKDGKILSGPAGRNLSLPILHSVPSFVSTADQGILEPIRTPKTLRSSESIQGKKESTSWILVVITSHISVPAGNAFDLRMSVIIRCVELRCLERKPSSQWLLYQNHHGCSRLIRCHLCTCCSSLEEKGPTCTFTLCPTTPSHACVASRIQSYKSYEPMFEKSRGGCSSFVDTCLCIYVYSMYIYIYDSNPI